MKAIRKVTEIMPLVCSRCGKPSRQDAPYKVSRAASSHIEQYGDLLIEFNTAGALCYDCATEWGRICKEFWGDVMETPLIYEGEQNEKSS